MFRDGLAATNPNSDCFDPLLQDIHSRARLRGHHTKPPADLTGTDMDGKGSSGVTVVAIVMVVQYTYCIIPENRSQNYCCMKQSFYLVQGSSPARS